MRRWLLASWSENFVSVRYATRLGPFKLTERARTALQFLEDHGWLIRADGATVDDRQRKGAWRIVRIKS